MIIFEIRDPELESAGHRDRVIAYLIYHERSRRFYAEIPQEVNEWEAPAMFYGFVKRGVRSIDHEWTMRWVRQRIVPSERQNIGAILKNNGLKYYDEYKLLCLCEGRCAQDETYIIRIKKDLLSDEIKERFSRKIRDVLPIGSFRMLVFFKNGTTRRIDMNELFKGEKYAKIRSSAGLFSQASVSPGGYAVEWGDNCYIMSEKLYESGRKVEISYEDILTFARLRLTDTTGACKTLGVTRQYIDQLTKQNRINPIISGEKCRIYLRSELEE